ncbi:hypothetical protein HAX54_035173, partial [Datura stramonium]|nr:hypothetical protein [Datura stramonium]
CPTEPSPAKRNDGDEERETIWWSFGGVVIGSRGRREGTVWFTAVLERRKRRVVVWFAGVSSRAVVVMAEARRGEGEKRKMADLVSGEEREVWQREKEGREGGSSKIMEIGLSGLKVMRREEGGRVNVIRVRGIG